MASNNKPIDPAIIIRKCDEALREALPVCQHYSNLVNLLGPNKDITDDIDRGTRKIRAARDMIKEYENG